MIKLPDEPFPALAKELRDATADLPVGPIAPFVLFGSSVMKLHGLREQVGDVDMFVRADLFEILYGRGWDFQVPNPNDPPVLEFNSAPPAHAFYDWKKRGWPIDVIEMLQNPKWVDGWPCQDLQQLCVWKATIAHHGTRPNDWSDVARIATYLGGL